MRKLRESRRGISPIVSSLLMLLITVISFATMLGYTNNFLSAQRSSALSTIRERLIVEDVWFHPNDTLTIYITNIGRAPVKIEEIHLNNENIEFTPRPLSLGLFDIGPVQLDYNWTSGTEYLILIAASGGYHIETTATAP